MAEGEKVNQAEWTSAVSDLVRYGQDTGLDRWMNWLYKDEPMCKCDHAIRSLGRVDGINMGKGWVRITTHPYCPQHGTKAEAARKAKLKSKGWLR